MLVRLGWCILCWVDLCLDRIRLKINFWIVCYRCLFIGCRLIGCCSCYRLRTLFFKRCLRWIIWCFFNEFGFCICIFFRICWILIRLQLNIVFLFIRLAGSAFLCFCLMTSVCHWCSVRLWLCCFWWDILGFVRLTFIFKFHWFIVFVFDAAVREGCFIFWQFLRIYFYVWRRVWLKKVNYS